MRRVFSYSKRAGNKELARERPRSGNKGPITGGVRRGGFSARRGPVERA